MTFSIVARCAETGMFGVAVTSSSPAVAARCAFAEAGIGAVTTQNVTDPSLGPRALKLLKAEAGADEVIETLKESAAHFEYRQVIVVDRHGHTAIYSGSEILGTWAEKSVPDIAAAGNLLANEDIPDAIVAAFRTASKPGVHMGERLIAALRGGLAAGGEAGPIHSAGMLVVDEVSWPIADLRVDWIDDDPIGALATLWDLYKPQMDDYVRRALNPAAAPSYGVPGDE